MFTEQELRDDWRELWDEMERSGLLTETVEILATDDSEVLGRLSRPNLRITHAAITASNAAGCLLDSIRRNIPEAIVFYSNWYTGASRKIRDFLRVQS